ncbi:MAG: hypothetical protein FJ267_17790, partial [Planctomycetes bacterium]|nr:hypothetical protein [Planctomycetota bacterium]
MLTGSVNRPFARGRLLRSLFFVAITWNAIRHDFLVGAEPKPQYSFAEITVVPATADEPKRETVSVALAMEYLERGAAAWNGQRKCVTCHTNGIYMTVRPALTSKLGNPSEANRQFFVETLRQLEGTKTEELLKSTKPAQVIYTAAGLAEWDKHVTKQVSSETDRA